MKKIPVLVIMLAMILSVTSCGNTEAADVVEESIEISMTPTARPTATVRPTATPKPLPSPTPQPTPTPYNGPVNPLTGLAVAEDISVKRPLAIMLNNIYEATPQHGISAADIIYETLAEGGITRMLGIFQDVTAAGNIGSIRSARAYYLDLAQGHDAIFVHAGGSPEAYDEIYNRGVASVDGVAGYSELFFRDEVRMYSAGYEHSLFTTSELLNEYIPTYSYRTEHEPGYSYKMEFADDSTPVSGETANELRVYFSDYKTGVFEYDKSSGLYKISQYGTEYVDGNTGEQIAVANVLVLYADMYVYDDAGRMDIDLVGTGDGLFVHGGKCIEISWRKEGYSSQFRYFCDDGSELIFGRGTSYVCIIPYGNSVALD